MSLDSWESERAKALPPEGPPGAVRKPRRILSDASIWYSLAGLYGDSALVFVVPRRRFLSWLFLFQLS